MIYAVNKRTKEHRNATGVYGGIADNWHVVQATPDGWIEWQGGECPLPGKAHAEYRMRDGGESQCLAKGLRWNHLEKGQDGSTLADIIAYRPILDADTKPEQAAWDGEGQVEAGMLAKCTRYANPVMVKFVGSKFSVVESDFGDECAMETHLLRPIRSEEDRAVKEMSKYFSAAGEPASYWEEEMRPVYAAIRDGKVPGVKLAGGE